MIEGYELQVKPAKWAFFQTDINKFALVNDEALVAFALAEPTVLHPLPIF
jgi:hypothetical protein